ncbi:hypothetical protein CYLTODRAFT_350629 [Cylindrobasidium torrendii FP15055 ss-10]|uniref:pH-response regulator protein palC n=1 Tax=Cylindrobasidium torrendii FP15055 ss-10 TaxID=1314674 RepID=A0A0D7BGW6_9AGAR|nr:hypothetical protein CYLTODRAFT_350629 [Cylindrobasidium torrendii FP15055 ss-10]
MSSPSSTPSLPLNWYEYELPTTGAISFGDLCTDMSAEKVYGRHIAAATQSRATVRGVLKEARKAGQAEKGGGRDYLRVALDDYIPRLRALIQCVAHDEVALTTEPVFSWRSTLSTHLLSTSSPRVSLPSLHADYVSVLLSYAYALSNLAWTSASSASSSSSQASAASQTSSTATPDEKLTHAVTFLCRASGVFASIAGSALPEWAGSRTGGLVGLALPVDYTTEVAEALAKIALADAQSLAIHKLLLRAAHHSGGAPLPKTHPAPALLAKLHLECAEMYGAARGLVKSTSGEVKPAVRRNLGERAAVHRVWGLMWLGVDAGEAGRGGEAVGFLGWAKGEAASLSHVTATASSGDSAADKKSLGISKKTKGGEAGKRIDLFLGQYTKANDTLYFESVLGRKELQARVPAGRVAVAAKPYVPPTPGFGPGSVEFERRQAGDALHESSGGGSGSGSGSGGGENKAGGEEVGQYAGAGAYF